jgi:hypothetical protein
MEMTSDIVVAVAESSARAHFLIFYHAKTLVSTTFRGRSISTTYTPSTTTPYHGESLENEIISLELY